MLVYRIAFKKYSHSLDASGVEGRWNGAGRKVIYTAESSALALLENMVRRKGTGFNNHYQMMIIEWPDTLKIEVVNVAALADGWRDYKDYSVCQRIGNQWYDHGKVPVLKVPSAVLPDAHNYVVNTTHTDFKQAKLLTTIPFIPDERIEDILKKYGR
jgi:RES domain-containing protein